MKLGILITTDDELSSVYPKNGTDFSFEELYPLLKCDTIEIVRLSSAEIMLIDESGKPNGKPVNRIASAMYKETRESPEASRARVAEMEAKGFTVFQIDEQYGYTPYDIAGNAIICPSDMVK